MIVDKDLLRRKGWRMDSGRVFTYPQRPKKFTLTMHLRGKRVDEVMAEGESGQTGRIYDSHRGFDRQEAKQLFNAKIATEIEDVIEALHNDFIVTM